jgi:CDP-diacylglycerol--glycerol-3-phosphate 3-phosphatidyltransferase
MVEPASARRPLKSRERAWAKSLAARLTRRGVAPNMISLASIGFSAMAAAFLLLARDGGAAMSCILLVGAAAAIQLRLLCNLIDGMVAVEGGRATRTGAIYNEIPDRVADVFILVAAGYGIAATGCAPALGWAAALLAVVTAYIRVLGGALGLLQDFCGPMAKQHRMAVMTVGCLAAIVELLINGTRGWSLFAALILVAVGSLLTAVRRLHRMVRAIETGEGSKS